ncbi:hypothetical protein [Nonomuraea zeae]|uniref:Uncharacterized protein n=1 Tax=Nonomuraea zeae TaxID=1642303 RepID=A0A5S4GM78_9ACTN|nr:hypothetical protein [Nonomuraea zeae]TMR34056.1 hypothetical protein ETD85_17980 [Nonomuraea zeae]
MTMIWHEAFSGAAFAHPWWASILFLTNAGMTIIRDGRGVDGIFNQPALTRPEIHRHRRRVRRERRERRLPGPLPPEPGQPPAQVGTILA